MHPLEILLGFIFKQEFKVLNQKKKIAHQENQDRQLNKKILNPNHF